MFIEIGSAKIPSVATSGSGGVSPLHRTTPARIPPLTHVSRYLSLSRLPSSVLPGTPLRVAIDFVVSFFLYSDHSLTPTSFFQARYACDDTVPPVPTDAEISQVRSSLLLQHIDPIRITQSLSCARVHAQFRPREGGKVMRLRIELRFDGQRGNYTP